jgi:hypothetical protein
MLIAVNRDKNLARQQTKNSQPGGAQRSEAKSGAKRCESALNQRALACQNIIL